MMFYPGDEFVKKEGIFAPYEYFDETGFHLRDDAPEEAKEAYKWCQEFVRNHPNYFN